MAKPINGPTGFETTVEEMTKKIETDELILAGVRWERGEPPENVLLEVRGSNCTGDWYTVGIRKDYKKPPRGKSKKGFKRGWRWLDEDGNTFEEPVEAWRPRPT